MLGLILILVLHNACPAALNHAPEDSIRLKNSDKDDQDLILIFENSKDVRSGRMLSQTAWSSEIKDDASTETDITPSDSPIDNWNLSKLIDLVKNIVHKLGDYKIDDSKYGHKGKTADSTPEKSEHTKLPSINRKMLNNKNVPEVPNPDQEEDSAEKMYSQLLEDSKKKETIIDENTSSSDIDTSYEESSFSEEKQSQPLNTKEKPEDQHQIAGKKSTDGKLKKYPVQNDHGRQFPKPYSMPVLSKSINYYDEIKKTLPPIKEQDRIEDCNSSSLSYDTQKTESDTNTRKNLSTNKIKKSSTNDKPINKYNDFSSEETEPVPPTTIAQTSGSLDWDKDNKQQSKSVETDINKSMDAESIKTTTESLFDNSSKNEATTHTTSAQDNQSEYITSIPSPSRDSTTVSFDTTTKPIIANYEITNIPQTTENILANELSTTFTSDINLNFETTTSLTFAISESNVEKSNEKSSTPIPYSLSENNIETSKPVLLDMQRLSEEDISGNTSNTVQNTTPDTKSYHDVSATTPSTFSTKNYISQPEMNHIPFENTVLEQQLSKHYDNITIIPLRTNNEHNNITDMSLENNETLPSNADDWLESNEYKNESIDTSLTESETDPDEKNLQNATNTKNYNNIQLMQDKVSENLEALSSGNFQEKNLFKENGTINKMSSNKDNPSLNETSSLNKINETFSSNDLGSSDNSENSYFGNITATKLYNSIKVPKDTYNPFNTTPTDEKTFHEDKDSKFLNEKDNLVESTHDIMSESLLLKQLYPTETPVLPDYDPFVLGIRNENEVTKQYSPILENFMNYPIHQNDDQNTDTTNSNYQQFSQNVIQPSNKEEPDETFDTILQFLYKHSNSSFIHSLREKTETR